MHFIFPLPQFVMGVKQKTITLFSSRPFPHQILNVVFISASVGIQPFRNNCWMSFAASLFVLQEAQTTIFEMSKMEWRASGGQGRFFPYVVTPTKGPLVDKGRSATRCDPRHYELCKPWFVHKMGVKHGRVPFYCLFVFIFLRSIFGLMWL